MFHKTGAECCGRLIYFSMKSKSLPASSKGSVGRCGRSFHVEGKIRKKSHVLPLDTGCMVVWVNPPSFVTSCQPFRFGKRRSSRKYVVQEGHRVNTHSFVPRDMNSALAFWMDG